MLWKGVRSNVRGWIMIAAIAALATVFGPAATAIADEPVVRAEVDRTQIGLDDRVTLEVIIEGRVRSIEEPQLPALDDWDIYGNSRSQSMQIVNGVMSVSTTFIYVLAPKREGTLTIGAFTTRIGGKEYKTGTITVAVGGGPGVRGAPAPAPGQEQTREDRDIFVVGRVDKQNAYVNEQILYTFYLYRAERSAQISNLSYQAPKFQGFWVEKLKDSEKQSYKVINNRRYIVTEVSTAIFPTTSGTLTIDPSVLQLMLLTSPFGFGFFDRGAEKILRTKPIAIEVAALPVSGKPAGFEGAVGEGLQLSARLDRTEVQEGDPVTLTMQVEGVGNVKTYSRPRLPDLPQFKIYDADSKTSVETLDRVAGSRTWETVLVPRDEGEYTLPAIRLSYFDTGEGAYRTLETKPMTITVLRGSGDSGAGTLASGGNDAPAAQQDIQILGKDLAHIRTDVPVSDAWTPLYRQGLFGVVASLPLVAALGASWHRRRRDRFATDIALARSTRARKQAAKRLAAARRAQEGNHGEVFYAEISRALRQFVGDKLNVSATGLTHPELHDAVVAAGAPAETASRVVELLDRCDAARFAPSSMGAERLRDTLHDAESLIVALDTQWARRGRTAPAAAGTTTAALAWLCVVAVAATAVRAQEAASPAEWLQRGHTAYEAGRFADAIAAYQQAERAGVRNGPLYFDLGNAHYKNGELAPAIACYRRAEMLSPRDPLVRSNLEFARARREDKAVQSGTMPVVAAVLAVFRSLSLNEWIAFCAGLYTLGCAVWIVGTFRRERSAALRAAFTTLVILFVVATGFTVAKVRAVRGTQHGVIAESRVAVMSGPGPEYTAEFSLHEGAEVRVEAQRSDWVRIAVTDQLRGWVPAGSIIGI